MNVFKQVDNVKASGGGEGRMTASKGTDWYGKRHRSDWLKMHLCVRALF